MGGKYNAPLTREKAAYLIVTLITASEQTENQAFIDLGLASIMDKKDVMYTGHVGRAIAKGFMRGYQDGTFKPKGFITRAESVIIINRIMEKDKRDPFVPNLKGKHYTTIELPNGETKYYIFPKAEYLNIFEAMDKVKDTTPGIMYPKDWTQDPKNKIIKL